MSKVDMWTRILECTSGRFFSISFVKKDGSTRLLNGKVGSRVDVDRTNHAVVFDAKKNAFRKVNLENVKHFICGEIEI